MHCSWYPQLTIQVQSRSTFWTSVTGGFTCICSKSLSTRPTITPTGRDPAPLPSYQLRSPTCCHFIWTPCGGHATPIFFLEGGPNSPLAFLQSPQLYQCTTTRRSPGIPFSEPSTATVLTHSKGLQPHIYSNALLGGVFLSNKGVLQDPLSQNSLLFFRLYKH